MNCQLCQKESDAYRRGELSGDMRTQVEEHLQDCADCAESYKMHTLAEKVINQEKAVNPDPNLTAMIMARLESSENPTETISPFTRVWKPALITASMAAAIFAGVLLGNIYKPSVRVKVIPVELALMDDAAIESVNILSYE